ncbi:MAG: hypothetical protein K1X67_25105 [Fimbriimonadaceae bacterium]|nr:hypothetical protein [Fimbriimonadaceae bacterium]
MSLFVISVAMLQSVAGQAPQGPDRVLKLIEQTRDTRYWLAAVHELAAMGPEVIPAVLAASRRDRSLDLLPVLTHMGSQATPTLLELIDDPQFGPMAFNNIVVRRDPVALPRLMKIAISTTDVQKRRSAISSISSFQGDAPLRFIEELMVCSDPELRSIAADAMSAAENATLEQRVRAFTARNGRPESVRLRDSEAGRAVLMNFVRQGHPVAARALEVLVFSPPDDVPFLKGLLYGADAPLREAAAKVLAALGTPAACQALIDAYDALPKSYDLSRRIVEAADLAEARGTLSLLEPWLRSHVRSVPDALTILVRWHPDDKSLLPLIRDRINGQDESRRKKATAVLLSMRTGDEVPILIEAFESTKWGKQEFIEALGKTRDPACLPFLLELYERDKTWRMRIIATLQYLPTSDVEGFLCEKLKDPDTWIRNSAISACGRAKVTAAVPQLCAMLDSQKESKENEDKILDTLARIATPATIKSLRSYVERNKNDREYRVGTALRAIEKAGGESAFEALVGLYKSLPPCDQSTILSAMGRLECKNRIAFLERVASDPVEYAMLRRTATDIIDRLKGRVTSDRTH